MSLRRLLVAVVFVELVALYVVLRNQSWVYDDNLFLVSARLHGFSLSWLLSLKYQHWGIAYNLLFTVLLHLFPLDYRWGLLLVLMLLGAAALLLERIVLMLFGARRTAMLVAALFTISILFVRQLEWWASGAQVFPTTFFDLLCLYGWLRYRADGSGTWLALSGCALASGLLFYEKPAFMLLYLVLIRVLFFSDELGFEAVVRAFWRERLQWGVYVAILAVWFVAYLSRHPSLAAGTVSFSQYLGYFRIFWLNTLVPALAGVVVPASHLATLQITFVSIAQVVALVAIGWSIARKSSAWRAWVFLAICVLVIGGLVARARVAQFGVQIANDTRYQFEFAWLVPLAVCFAFSRRRTLEPLLPLASPTPPPLRRRTVILVAVFCASYAVASLASANHLARVWPGSMARAWHQHLQAGLAAAQRGHRRIVIADNATPDWIISSPFAPFNSLLEMIPLYDSRVHVDGPLIGTLVTLTSDGHVTPATIGPTIGDGSIQALVRSGAATLPPGSRLPPRAKEVCLSTGAWPLQIERRMASPPTAAGSPYYVKLTYSTRQTLNLAMRVDAGSGHPYHQAANALIPTARTSITWLGQNPPRLVKLTLPPHANLCIERIDIVTLTNAAS